MEYATLIMMIVTFLQERQSTKDRSLQGLKDYLIEKNFCEVIEFLENNEQAQKGIELLLKSEFTQIQDQLKVITDTLTSVTSKLDGFSQIVTEESGLTEQALYILKEVKDRENGILFLNGEQLAIAPWFSGFLNSPEPRFLEDDIKLLLSYNWITNSGRNTYKITRAGYRASEQLFL
ncbi:hypothetical protein [Rubritalea squalenifaciens]|nr:hypothetical protein [Rubritalea squalenifaciens]